MAEERQTATGSVSKALEPWTPLRYGFWLAVPEFFLDRYQELGLRAGHAMLVLHLLRHRRADGFACEKIKDLADRMGLSYNQVRNYIADLKKEHLLRVVRVKGKPCIYDLRPLCEELEKRRKQAEAVAVARARRVGGHLRG